jgi:hypothetical protein
MIENVEEEKRSKIDTTWLFSDVFPQTGCTKGGEIISSHTPRDKPGTTATSAFRMAPPRLLVKAEDGPFSFSGVGLGGKGG